MAYEATPGPLPGHQYIPSNSTEGHGFIGSWCSTCARDRSIREGIELDECDDDEVCQIVAASFRGEAVEWRRMPRGNVLCTAYVSYGEAVPPPRCTHNLDLFSGPNVQIDLETTR